jgi:hypothetical protein
MKTDATLQGNSTFTYFKNKEMVKNLNVNSIFQL